ncbi:MAG: D-glycero-beta-D-manno-heptose-7-phosphate kinase [Vicinamibacteria bacterium]|nr:D-glycero-beta-D-manno-heptose-7-phosphate kinase [Vicinamibacteria bacterium]
MKLPTSRRARSLAGAMQARRVLVLGDLMLDEFVWGRVSRISPEAPVPVVEVTRESVHLGGAGNVACNVRSLGGCVALVGVVGQDAAGYRIREELDAMGVDGSMIAAGDNRPTTIKTRIIAHHQQIVRADRENAADVDEVTSREIIAALRRFLPACQAMVISDYQKGVIMPRVARAALSLSRKHRVPVLVDPKVRHFALYKGVAVVTPNQLETEQVTGIRIRTDDDLEAAAARILRRLRCEAVLVTRGEHGMSLFRRDRPAAHVPTFAREVYDVTGAGDTVVATMALAIAAGARLDEAAVLANCAAGVVVGKVGTATADIDEVLASVASMARKR